MTAQWGLLDRSASVSNMFVEECLHSSCSCTILAVEHDYGL
jgi:hypothetical protein